MAHMPLPILSCDNCAICCGLQSSPPYMPTELEAIPAALLAEIEAYQADPNRDESLPCFWLEDGKCRHYEHRPEVCRQFECGGEDCRDLRQRAGIR